MINIKIDNEEDAARFWINRDWSMIPTSLLERAYNRNEGDAEKLELLAGGERTSDCHESDVTMRDATDEEADEHQDNDGKVAVCSDCGRVCPVRWGGAVYGWPAAHGWLFSPNDRIDQEWVKNNAAEIADKCGFLIYECDEGIMLGIDGGGYDFYEAHFIPLYRLRGLPWHEPEAPATPPAKPRKPKAKAKAKAKPKTKAPVKRRDRKRRPARGARR